MKIDKPRIKSYLLEIRRNSDELKTLMEQNHLKPGSIALKAAKYLLIEMAEAMSNVLQHVLAREKGIAVSGYIDTIVKADEYGLISERLFNKLKPFFDFRNSLIHRYWVIDDIMLIENILKGRTDFDQFVDEIESYVKC
ncbi:MAG: HepT-like ribonuclease domain-containing protein [Syntrophaceae bacterium]